MRMDDASTKWLTTTNVPFECKISCQLIALTQQNKQNYDTNPGSGELNYRRKDMTAVAFRTPPQSKRLQELFISKRTARRSPNNYEAQSPPFAIYTHGDAMEISRTAAVQKALRLPHHDPHYPWYTSIDVSPTTS